MGIVFAEMSSRTALPWYKLMEKAFWTKNMKNESFGIFIIKILPLRVIEENSYLKKYGT